MSTAARWMQMLRPPYSLANLVLAAAALVISSVAAVYGSLAYERLASETLESTRRWTDSLARVVASNSAEPLILNDVASVESNLQQLVDLPGVIDLAVFRSNGQPLLEVSKHQGKTLSQIGGSTRVMPAAPDARGIRSRVNAQFYESWAEVKVGSSASLGWVRIQTSLADRGRDLERLWHQSLTSTVLTVLLVLALLHLVIRWALRPILALSSFAEKMPERLGSRLHVASTCLEANQLSAALNQASQTIAERMGQVQAIVNTAGDAIIGVDRQGIVVTCNPATLRMFDRGTQDIDGQPLQRLIPGLDQETLTQMLSDAPDHAATPSRVVRLDFHGRRADGSEFPVEMSLGEVLNSDQLRYACIVRDVSIERAAREQSKLYEQALASSHNAVFILDAKRQFKPLIYVNDAFLEMTGKQRHEVIGSTLQFVEQFSASPDSLMKLQHGLDAGEISNATLHYQRGPGDPRVAEVSLSPVRTGQGEVLYFVGIASDVTARNQAEDLIAERSTQLHTIFTLSPDGFALFDAEQQLVFANPALQEMTGNAWSRGDTPITLPEFSVELGKLCDPASQQLLAERWSHPAMNWQTRVHLVRPQRRVVQVQKRNQVSGRRETILYFRDVTHEDEVDRMKSEFLATAAHELRTPMVSIFGYTELLMTGGYPAEIQAEMLSTIHRQCELLVHMINELLDLARIEARQGMDLKIVPCDLPALIDQTVKGLMLKGSERQVTVRDLPATRVLVDAEKLQIALNNLLSNAFKYSPDGGEVSVGARLDVRQGAPFAVIEITDHGLGMKPEQLARAFERFYRADTTGNIPGTGLGLSMVKEIITLLNGHIELQSEFGQGTTARVWVPLP